MLCWYLSPLATLRRVIAKERPLVKCYSSSREQGANNLQNSWREQRDLCPVIGHLVVSRSDVKTPEFLRCMAAWIADQGRTMDRSFVGWNPQQPTRSLVQDLPGLHPVKKKRQKMKTRAVATPSTAGALTKAGGTSCSVVGPSKPSSVPLESGNQYWGFIGCPATRFYWPAWPDLLTHNFSSTQIASRRCHVAFGVHHSIALEGANVCMNRHEGKLLVAQHETVTGVKLPASCLYHPVNLMPSVWPYPKIIVFIPNKKRGDF